MIFYVGSRGHQSDIGGITPASMPPNSVRVEEEGVLIDNFKLVDQGVFQEVRTPRREDRQKTGIAFKNRTSNGCPLDR